MENFGRSKTYAKCSLKYKSQQSKLLSDLFDKVAQDTADEGDGQPLRSLGGNNLTTDHCPANQGNRDRRQKKKADQPKRKKQDEEDEGGSGDGVEKMDSSSPGGVDNDDDVDARSNASRSPCPLFETMCEEYKPPKKPKAAVSRPRGVAKKKKDQGRKTGGTNSTMYRKLKKLMKKASPGGVTAPQTSTPVVTASSTEEYPSRETFRDLQNESFSWSSIHKESGSSCRQWLASSLSMSSSFSHSRTLTARSGGGGTEEALPTLLPPRRSATPANFGRQHSFVKIRTPTPLPAYVEQPSAPSDEDEDDAADDHGDEDGNAGGSSYTTVYTWTTATTSTTGTRTATKANSTTTSSGTKTATKPNSTATRTKTATKPNSTATSTGTKTATKPNSTATSTGTKTATKPNSTATSTGIKTATKPNSTATSTRIKTATKPNSTATSTGIKTATKPNSTATSTGTKTATKPNSTATSTGTRTATKANSKQPGQDQKGVGAADETEVSSSPTVEFKALPPDQPLQSTAILPHQDPAPFLLTSPHVSPIRPLPGDEDHVHQTPSAPTQHVSPRGPRKTQSFSTRGRVAPPKCSTMLMFAPQMADYGDAPLDVSSIRTALSEATDLNEDNHIKDKEKKRLNQEDPTGDRVLTSTPCRQHKDKFKWNLSSVQPWEEEEDLLQMNHTGDTVNSQEIVALTLSEHDLQGQEREPANMIQQCNEDRKMKVDEESREGRGGESGVVVTTPDPQNTPLFTSTPLSHHAFTKHRQTHRSARNEEEHALHEEHNDILMTPVTSRGDGSALGKKEIPFFRTPTTTIKAMSTKSHIFRTPKEVASKKKSDTFRSSRREDSRKTSGKETHSSTITSSEVLPRKPQLEGSSSLKEKSWRRISSKDIRSSAATTTTTAKTKLRKHTEREMPYPQKEKCSKKASLVDELFLPQGKSMTVSEPYSPMEGRSSVEDIGGEVPPCPVSLTGWRGEGGLSLSSSSVSQKKSGLFLWVEPADSGFLDMVNNTPPDIVDAVSRKAKERKLQAMT